MYFPEIFAISNGTTKAFKQKKTHAGTEVSHKINRGLRFAL
jgi:hypothetical protein